MITHSQSWESARVWSKAVSTPVLKARARTRNWRNRVFNRALATTSNRFSASVLYSFTASGSILTDASFCCACATGVAASYRVCDPGNRLGTLELFVAGAAAAGTPEGLPADKQFFILQFQAMILVLVVFRLGISLSKDKLKRPFGLVLLATYLVVTILSYIFGSQG